MPLRPTVVVARFPKFTDPPDMSPSQADGARDHELDFRFKLESAKLNMIQPKTSMTRETKLQKYQEVNNFALGSWSRGLKQQV